MTVGFDPDHCPACAETVATIFRALPPNTWVARAERIRGPHDGLPHVAIDEADARRIIAAVLDVTSSALPAELRPTSEIAYVHDADGCRDCRWALVERDPHCTSQHD